MTHTNLALAKGRDKEAEDRKKALRYNNRSETSGSKGNSKRGTYSSSTYKRHDANRSRIDTRSCEYLSPAALMLKIERGEGISCDKCRSWCTRRDRYVCLTCRLDNERQIKHKLYLYAENTSRDKRPGINYEEFDK